MVLGMPIHAVGYHPACWLVPGVPPDGAMSLRHAMQCARIAERGKLDFVFLADTGAVRNLDNPAIPREREHEHVKLEPLSLLAALATGTRDIGLVATVSTTYSEPYNLARALASLDHISKGRAGWNLVTGFALDEAQNYGLDAIAPSPVRHARAREFVQVLRGLLDELGRRRLRAGQGQRRHVRPRRACTGSSTRALSSACAARWTLRARRRPACRS